MTLPKPRVTERPRPPSSTPGLFAALPTMFILACAKPDTSEDSSTEEDSARVGDGQITLRFFTAIEPGGFGFGLEEGDGYGLLRKIQGDGVVVAAPASPHVRSARPCLWGTARAIGGRTSPSRSPASSSWTPSPA